MSGAWTSSLPTFEPLPASTSSLIRPFSLFSLFRSAPALPSEILLNPLLALPLDRPAPPESTLKAITSFHTFLTQLKAKATLDSHPDKLMMLGIKALGTYLHAFYHSARADQCSDPHVPEHTSLALRCAAGTSLDGIFYLRHHLSASLVDDGPNSLAAGATLVELDQHILAAAYPPRTAHQLLTPIFSRSREAVAQLQHAVRSVVGKGQAKGASVAEREDIGEGAAMALFALLHRFAGHVSELNDLGLLSDEARAECSGLEAVESDRCAKGTSKSSGKEVEPKSPEPRSPAAEPKRLAAEQRRAEKERKEAEERKHDAEEATRCRALRIGLEAEVLRVDLGMSMTNAKMKEVKRRAGVGGRDATHNLLDVRPFKEDDLEDSEEDPEEDEGAALESASNVKPKRSSLSPIARGSVQPPEVQTEEEAPDSGAIRWEILAEEALVATLRRASSLVEEGRSRVLVDKVEREDWVEADGTGNASGLTSAQLIGNGTQTLEDTAHGATNPSGGPNDDNGDHDEDQSDENSSSSASSLSSSSLSLTLAHPCPLRSLFRLYDRFEEQRLAVWLALPTDGREKMGAYMRGTGGKAGEAWDALGLGLMFEFDGDTLLAYGLALDKLDKWVDLASRRTAKRIRRRGRGTGARA